MGCTLKGVSTQFSSDPITLLTPGLHAQLHSCACPANFQIVKVQTSHYNFADSDAYKPALGVSTCVGADML